MPLSSKHPFYAGRMADWEYMRDAFAGERVIKSEGVKYLPATDLMRSRGLGAGRAGSHMYDTYRERAVYHEIVKPALEAMLGVMHRKPAHIQVPEKMIPMLSSMAFQGEDAQSLLVRINENQLLMGQIGLMLDVADKAPAGALPYVVSYSAESIFNWDASKVSDDEGARALQFVVLSEAGHERAAGFNWELVQRYRVLAMADSVDDMFPGVLSQFGKNYIAGAVVSKEEITPGDFRAVELAGTSLASIPFVFIGPRNLSPEPDQPTLLPLARIALAIYRGEADYRQSLFMQGQQTLVIIGAAPGLPQGPTADGGNVSNGVEVGANATIELQAIPGADAKYIGASAAGLDALAAAIQEDKRQAAHLGANLLETQGGAAESGDALLIRSSARTSSLTTVAKTGAEGLKRLLKHAAVWIGADPDKVVVEPNLDFADAEVSARDLVDLMTAKMMGAPISKNTVHWWMQQKEFTNKTIDEELDAIGDEGPDDIGGTPGLAGNPGAPAGGDLGAKPVKTGKRPARKTEGGAGDKSGTRTTK